MFKLVLSAAAFSALVSAYTTPTTQCTDGCNPIGKPGLNEVVPAGGDYAVTWKPTTEGTVTIVLAKGPATNIIPLYPLAEKVANTGSYSWAPASDLEPTGNEGYGIQIINDADGTYQWSTQFGISNDAYTGSPAPTGSEKPTGGEEHYGHNSTVTAATSEPSGFSNSTAAVTSMTETESTSATPTSGSTTLRTTGASSTATESSPAQNSNGAVALGASVGGGFLAIMAAVAAL